MKHDFRRVLAVLMAVMVILMFSVIIAGRTSAEEYPEIKVVSINDNGRLTWDAYPGATFYMIFLDDRVSFGANSQPFDVNEQIDYFVNERLIGHTGVHTLTLMAYGDDDEVIAESSFRYEYTSTNGPGEMGEITNIFVNEDGFLSWDEYPGTQNYWVEVDHYVSRPTDKKFKYLNEDIDDYVLDGYIKNTSSHIITVKAVDDEGNHITMGEITYDYVSPYSYKGLITGVEISPKGMLSWDDYPGAVRYSMLIDWIWIRSVYSPNYDLVSDIDEYVTKGRPCERRNSHGDDRGH